MKRLLIALKIFIYGLIIPVLVAFLAEIGISLSAKYYWGEEFIKHNSNIQFMMFMLFTWASLTFVYYVFCILYKLIKRDYYRKILLIIILVFPVILDNLSIPRTADDLVYSISFVLFHATYYILFFITSYLFKTIHFKWGKKLSMENNKNEQNTL